MQCFSLNPHTCVSGWSCSPLKRDSASSSTVSPPPPFALSLRFSSLSHPLPSLSFSLSVSFYWEKLYRFLGRADGAVSFQLPDANIAATRVRGLKRLPPPALQPGERRRLFTRVPGSCPAITRQLTDPLDFANFSRTQLARRLIRVISPFARFIFNPATYDPQVFFSVRSLVEKYYRDAQFMYWSQ